MSQLTLEGINPCTIEQPFAWPGSKRRFVSTILAHMPQGLDEMVSPFVGSGSVELAVAAQGVRVHASDANPDLVALWNLLLHEPGTLADHLASLRGCTRDQFKAAVSYKGREGKERAKALYLRLRGCLFHVASSQSPHERPQDDGSLWCEWKEICEPASCKAVAAFHNPTLSVKLADCIDALAEHGAAFAYCDPPYVETREGVNYTSLYSGHAVDHDRLALQLRTRPGPWVLSINDCEWARDTFAGFHIVPLSVKWMMAARKGKQIAKTGELLIVSEGW